MSNEQNEPYNGAAFGYSPYDMDASECRYWECDHLADDVDDDYDDDGDYDCCDDAEDYGEDVDDDSAEND